MWFCGENILQFPEAVIGEEDNVLFQFSMMKPAGRKRIALVLYCSQIRKQCCCYNSNNIKNLINQLNSNGCVGEKKTLCVCIQQTNVATNKQRADFSSIELKTIQNSHSW